MRPRVAPQRQGRGSDAIAAAGRRSRAGAERFRLNLAEGLAQTARRIAPWSSSGCIIAIEPTNAQALSRFYALESEALLARREWPKLYANGVAWTKADPNRPRPGARSSRGAFEDGRLLEAAAAFARACRSASRRLRISPRMPAVSEGSRDGGRPATRSIRRRRSIRTFPQMLATRALRC